MVVATVWYAHLELVSAAMTVEFAGMLALTLALTAVGPHLLTETRAGLFATPALFAMLVASGFVPERWRPLPMDPISTRWFDLYGRWGIALCASVLVFLIASWDPARPNRVRAALVRAVGRRPKRPEPVAHPRREPERVPR